MDTQQILYTAVGLVITTGLGIIAFFVKRSFSKQDALEKKLEDCASVEDIKECRKEIKSLNEKYATKEELKAIADRIDKIETGVEFLKENTVRSSEFIRIMTKLEGKIDDLIKRGN